MKTIKHKGQVALVLVLIMTVVSALAVSLASRSTVDTRIQQTESENVQALIFAQTGLEQLILNPAPTSGSEDGNYHAVTSDVGTDSIDFGRVEEGSTVEINLDSHSSSLTDLIVHWGPDRANPSDQPAIFISRIANTGNVYNVALGYNNSNGFITADNSSEPGFAKQRSLSLFSGTVKIRITVLGTAALMKIIPVGAAFPAQIKSIKSTGSVVSGDKSVKYGLQYDESASDTVPGVFDYALFSGGSIIQ